MNCENALITGAGRGIGRAVALALGREGVTVALVARSEDELKAVAAEVKSLGSSAKIFPFDLGATEAIPTLVKQVVEEMGSVDLLVNNAGVFVEKPLPELSADDWERSLNINLTAPFVLCREVLPHMQECGGGRIINIASTAAQQGYLNQGAYCASKHGLLGLGRVLAIEAKPMGIHVHTLCPGGVDTDFIAGTYLASRLEGEPMLRPEDIAEQVVFLARQPGNVDIAEITTRRFIP